VDLVPGFQELLTGLSPMLHTLRRASVRQHVLAMAPNGRGSRKLARLLEHAVAMAA